ncbi:hypothetical protein C8K36_10926 [Rhodococcus sp. OK519]|uniref:hypothetical protein n=1 Tax=Rhodococcus sp. OK519 TaxID=2135729 RepID=UPI000D39BE0C|nr:hypothetical protein C8K36_10926 [Rhodococcus sp. OK519]
MKLKKFAATSVLVVAAMGVGAGTSYADPTPAPSQIGYQAHIDGPSVVTVLDAGGFRVTSDGKFVQVRDDAGQVLQSLPLTYRIGDREFSIAPVVEGRQLTLTPETDPAKATMADIAGPTLPPLPIDLSMLDKLAEGVDSAVTVGTLVGTVVGALAGCLIGFATGCLPAMVTFAPIGGIVGTIVAAGPVLAYNGWQIYQTMNAPAPAVG